MSFHCCRLRIGWASNRYQETNEWEGSGKQTWSRRRYRNRAFAFLPLLSHGLSAPFLFQDSLISIRSSAFNPHLGGPIGPRSSEYRRTGRLRYSGTLARKPDRLLATLAAPADGATGYMRWDHRYMRHKQRARVP